MFTHLFTYRDTKQNRHYQVEHTFFSTTRKLDGTSSYYQCGCIW